MPSHRNSPCVECGSEQYLSPGTDERIGCGKTWLPDHCFFCQKPWGEVELPCDERPGRVCEAVNWAVTDCPKCSKPGRPSRIEDFAPSPPEAILGLEALFDIDKLRWRATDGMGGLSLTNLELVTERFGSHLPQWCRDAWLDLASLYVGFFAHERQKLRKASERAANG